MTHPIEIALVGAGKVATLHAQAISRLACVRLASVCDPLPDRAESLAALHGAAVQPFERVLRDEAIQAVIVATPSHLHLSQARQCVAAGKHVLCEFPLFGPPGELARLFDAAARRGRVLSVAHTTHYLQPCLEARRRIAGGELGPLHTVLYRRRLYRPGGIAPDRDWRDNALTHLGGHALDLVTWLLDDGPASLSCLARPSAREAGTTGLLARMTRGALAAVFIDFESRPNGIMLEVAGRDHTLTVSGFSKVEVDGRAVWQAEDDDATLSAAIADQDRGFAGAVAGECDAGAGATVPPETTLRLNDWMARAIRSAQRT